MYVMPNGEEIFVIDGHTHLWDASPANHKNRHGKEFIDCFYDYHRNLSPADYVWPKEKFERYPLETMVQDLFVDGYDDMAIFQPTYLTDFYETGFNTTEQNAVAKRAYPDRFILNGAFDPREEERGLDYLQGLVEEFIVEHVGLPRLDDFCWIATQEPNVYGGLAVAMPFIHSRPGYFAHIISELLFWLGADRLLFASDYAIWHPKWIIEKFMAFELPQEVQKETGVNLTLDVKRKILGENAAKLYDIDIPAQKARLKRQRIPAMESV